MWKKVFAGAAALIVAGTMTVYAEEPSREPSDGRPSVEGKGAFADEHLSALHAGVKLNLEDIVAFEDAHIAALHAGLALDATQEKIWPAFEQALRDVSKMRMERLSAGRDQQPSSDPVQRLQRQADALNTRGAVLKRLADTMAPIYQSLNDGQKRRFTVLAEFMEPRARDIGMGWRRNIGHGGMRGGDNFPRSPHDVGDGGGNPD